MNIDIYQCPICGGTLKLLDSILRCNSCGEDYRLMDGSIPLFAQPESSKKTTIGLVGKLFELPGLYKLIVQLKYKVAPDKKLGIDDITVNSSLLNVGCGSDIEALHLEYSPKLLKFLAATDISAPFIAAAKKSCNLNNAEFCISSAMNLPYKDNTFDVVMIPFVLHHLPYSIPAAISEALRVTSNYVIIFDHIKSEKFTLWRYIQTLYWKIMDGGFQYLTASEWNDVLRDYNKIKELKTGALGGHVYKFIIKK
jgi:ubiquinone/menaquinone biosynthesis C-methylase UbiE